MFRSPLAVWFRWLLGGYVIYAALIGLLYAAGLQHVFDGWTGFGVGIAAGVALLIPAEWAERRARRRIKAGER